MDDTTVLENAQLEAETPRMVAIALTARAPCC
jgi:hypothetical protein